MVENVMKLPLFDDYWIDFRRGTVRRWYVPKLFSECTEGDYSSLFYDSIRGKYRYYYEALRNEHEDGPRNLMLLESEDMVHFTQALSDEGDVVIFDGTSGLHGASVMLDLQDPDPERRYKFCGMTHMYENRERHGFDPVILAFSPDGIHWTEHRELVANAQTSDALNKLMFNPLTDEYVLFHRSAYADRRIAVRSSKDLKHWSPPRIILHPGAVYNDEHTGMQHYSMSAKWFGGVFYGLLWRFSTCLYGDDFRRRYGYIEPELVYSYDGKEFLYTSGKPLMERPDFPEPGCTGLCPNDMCESADGKYYFIACNGSVCVHGADMKSGEHLSGRKERGLHTRTLFYRIRKDGFCGIESVTPGGLVITKALELLDTDLSFNVNASLGSVRFGIMDRFGKFIDGFSLDDCVPFSFEDAVAAKPVWKEHSIGELLGKRIRLAVELNTAVLHCITGTARPSIVQSMKGFADPEGLPEEENAPGTQ